MKAATPALVTLGQLGIHYVAHTFDHDAAADGLAGVQQLAGDATLLFYMTEEGQEGRDAYMEKRDPDFGKFPKRP